jgi:hypothetical protein
LDNLKNLEKERVLKVLFKMDKRYRNIEINDIIDYLSNLNSHKKWIKNLDYLEKDNKVILDIK